MKATNVDLLLSTPEGMAGSIITHWRENICELVGPQSNHGAVATRVGKLHHDIMQDHQKTWYQLCNRGFDLEENLRYRNAVEEILQSLPPNRNLAIADPLLCFLAPLWKMNLQNPVVIFCYSHPMECARVLQKTWRFPMQFGLALWEYYVISALDQAREEKFLLFSMDRYQRSPADYGQKISNNYHSLKNGREFPAAGLESTEDAADSPREQYLHEDEFLSKVQITLYEALESQDLHSLRDITLSAQAKDLLFHYGNLRSGFDAAKAGNPDPGAKNEKESSTVEVTAPPNDESHPMDTGEPLVEVRVHIDGLPPQEFVTSADNPVLQVLNDAIQNRSISPHDIIYLQGGESENGAIYFTAHDLQAVESQVL